MNDFPSVSIIGCGWLGRPLGISLVERGVTVQGSTTSPAKLESLEKDGIEPVLLTLDPDLSETDPESLFQSEVLVLNIPPPRTDDVQTRLAQQIKAVLEAAERGMVEWILYASSTSVYPNVERTVSESDVPPGQPDALSGPRRRTGTALLEAERLLMTADAVDATVVRLAGLYGGDRHPGRFLSGRSDVGRPDARVNLLHQDDAVGVFLALLEQDRRGEVFNACADDHPTRRTFYTRAAERLGLDAPTFYDGDTTTGKVVANEKIKRLCNYTFRHPDPLADLDGQS